MGIRSDRQSKSSTGQRVPNKRCRSIVHFGAQLLASPTCDPIQTRKKRLEEEEEMQNKWSRLGFAKSAESPLNIKNVCAMLKQNLNAADTRPPVLLGHGDPSAFPRFRTTPVAEEAIVEALRSAEFNSYAPMLGLLEARRLWSLLVAFLPLRHIAVTCISRYLHVVPVLPSFQWSHHLTFMFLLS